MPFSWGSPARQRNGPNRIAFPADAAFEVTGFARLYRARLAGAERDSLTRELGELQGSNWTMLFTHLRKPGTPTRPTRWTLLTPGCGYAESLADGNGSLIQLTVPQARERFPLVFPGWTVADDLSARALLAASTRPGWHWRCRRR
jgi:hypothetical protein